MSDLTRFEKKVYAMIKALESKTNKLEAVQERLLEKLFKQQQYIDSLEQQLNQLTGVDEDEDGEDYSNENVHHLDLVDSDEVYNMADMPDELRSRLPKCVLEMDDFENLITLTGKIQLTEDVVERLNEIPSTPPGIAILNSLLNSYLETDLATYDCEMADAIYDEESIDEFNFTHHLMKSYTYAFVVKFNELDRNVVDSILMSIKCSEIPQCANAVH